jgi:hypothetical protein
MFIPEQLTPDLAGLLTYSLFKRLPIANKKQQWPECLKRIMEITAAGTVQDLHLIPFSFCLHEIVSKNQSSCKYSIFFIGRSDFANIDIHILSTSLFIL